MYPHPAQCKSPVRAIARVAGAGKVEGGGGGGGGESKIGPVGKMRGPRRKDFLSFTLCALSTCLPHVSGSPSLFPFLEPLMQWHLGRKLAEHINFVT